MTVGWNTQKSGMKTFWKKCSRRKRTRISAAVYIIISLTTLFLLFLPLVLILLFCSLLHTTEIDGLIPMQGGSALLLKMYFRCSSNAHQIFIEKSTSYERASCCFWSSGTCGCHTSAYVCVCAYLIELHIRTAACYWMESLWGFRDRRTSIRRLAKHYQLIRPVITTAVRKRSKLTPVWKQSDNANTAAKPLRVCMYICKHVYGWVSAWMWVCADGGLLA